MGVQVAADVGVTQSKESGHSLYTVPLSPAHHFHTPVIICITSAILQAEKWSQWLHSHSNKGNGRLAFPYPDTWKCCLVRGAFSRWLCRLRRVLQRSGRRHMSITCMSHVCHMHVTCMSHACHMCVTCMSHECHMHVTCVSHACHMSVTCMSHVCHMHVTCLVPATYAMCSSLTMSP